MKLFLKILGGLFSVIVLVLIAANIFVSPEAIQSRVAERIKQQTGRELIVNGEASLTFLPNPEMVLTDTTLRDPGTDSTAIDLHVSRLEVTLDLFELISQRVDARYVLFEKPLITVRPGSAQTAPQQRSEGSVPEKTRRASLPAPQEPRFAKGSMALAATGDDDTSDVRLREVEIEDGTVRILDEEGQVNREIEHINASLQMPHIDEPLRSTGDFQLKGKTLNYDLTLTSAGALRAGRQADVALVLSSDAFKGQFEGAVVPEPEPSASGVFKGTASSFKDVIAWTPDGGQPAKPVIPGEISSQVKWSFAGATLSNLAFQLGDTKGRGQAALHLDSPKPHLRAALAIELLNVTPFLPQGGSAGRQAAPKRPAPEPIVNQSGGQPSGGGNAFPNDFPETPPQDDPAAAMQPGATQPKEPSPIDADVNVNVRQTRVDNITIGPSALSFAFRDGVLTANLGGMQLYGGEGRGKLIIDQNPAVPVFSANLNLDRVDAKPFLTDAAEFDRLSGKIKVIFKLNGKGQEAEAIKSSLTGNGNILVSQGAVEGIDITGILAQVNQGQLPKVKGGSTKFDSLGGSFTMRKGIAQTNNFQLVSQYLKVGAKGTVDIPSGTMDILANPELVAAPEGMGDAKDLVGLTIPIRIQGPFENPTYRPEVAGLFNNPEAASKTINKLGDVIQKKFKDKPVGDALGRFLGGVKIQGGNQ
ncbi:putative assembly protein [Methyloligella halotolerans]|uniref:Putative assembly protein n=1 Tax=Methyloligella halotolerans TaxID=1177755 RepID=A0A1E2RW70_9HYPH|nr:AsmA family protein [Methyloligella halotolerans]ODA66380.1 putative assembly protein [Methyloligella halotolerans]